MSTRILGISAYYHDAAAALVKDGKIVAAAQEERFTRKKHDASFPAQAIRYCLEQAGCDLPSLDAIIFYDKPLVKFERLLETYISTAPRGLRSFFTSMPVWLKEKLYLKQGLRRELCRLADCPRDALPKLLFSEHHRSHAASAFFPSPFEKAAVLCLDGVGEWATSSVWQGDGSKLTPLWEIRFPHSLGLLYSAFTYFCGFKVNSGEYKLMGLAPYGEPRYADLIREKLIDIKQDGTFRLDQKYFDYATGLRMTNRRFADLFGGPARSSETAITQREMDLAASVQAVTEDIVLRLANTIHKETGNPYLCLAGGVALNCVANGRLLREGPFQDIWIQPAAGDAGGALGAAFVAAHDYFHESRPVEKPDAMQGGYLGPQYTRDTIRQQLESAGANYREYHDDCLLPQVAEFIAKDQVVGWFQGRMEFGPRALGGRSIIGNPQSAQTQKTMNLKIKYRESFRPFAPSVLEERASEYFELDRTSPYMLVVAPVVKERRLTINADQQALTGIDKLDLIRSDLPAITHVDYSARIQTVNAATNPRYHALLRAFEQKTGCPVLVNTSFNVRGEPIVCTPEDAYRCFMRTEMDALVIENFLLLKSDQPAAPSDGAWQQEFELD